MKLYLTVHQWESDIRSTLCMGGETTVVTALLHQEAPPTTWILTAVIDQQKKASVGNLFPKSSRKN